MWELSFLISDWTHISCIWRQSFSPGTGREVPRSKIFNSYVPAQYFIDYPPPPPPTHIPLAFTIFVFTCPTPSCLQAIQSPSQFMKFLLRSYLSDETSLGIPAQSDFSSCKAIAHMASARWSKIAVALSDSVKLSIEFTALSNILLLLFGAKLEVLIVVVHPAYHHCGCKSEAYK